MTTPDAFMGGAASDLCEHDQLKGKCRRPGCPDGFTSSSAAAPESRFTSGGKFILDAPKNVPVVWGAGGDILWAQGQSVMLCGSNGVGKTTLGGQLLKGRLGLVDQVLDHPIASGRRNVLYLAMDRPSQIRQSLARQFRPSDREVLDERLKVYEGPPPYDLAKHPEILLALCEEADADTVFVDSLKDAAIGLTSDEVGAGYNRSRQLAIAGGVEIFEAHHQTKRSATGGRPDGIEDVYGSAFLTAGAGSVVLLAGEAGDPVVRLKHLKPVVDSVGPFEVKHGQDGTSYIVDQLDLRAMASATGVGGLTKHDVARRIFGTTQPTRSQLERAARKLDKLTAEGGLTKVPGERGNAGRPSRWYTA
ncbi:AAA family ATPase [Streptomyces sp. NPDC002787]